MARRVHREPPAAHRRSDGRSFIPRTAGVVRSRTRAGPARLPLLRSGVVAEARPRPPGAAHGALGLGLGRGARTGRQPSAMEHSRAERHLLRLHVGLRERGALPRRRERAHRGGAEGAGRHARRSRVEPQSLQLRGGPRGRVLRSAPRRGGGGSSLRRDPRRRLHAQPRTQHVALGFAGARGNDPPVHARARARAAARLRSALGQSPGNAHDELGVRLRAGRPAASRIW